MSNGRCDICGNPAAYRVKMVENGFRKVKELCEEHYQELARHVLAALKRKIWETASPWIYRII